MMAVINIIAPTKAGDVYKEVALCKYPIVVRCNNEDELRSLLAKQNEYIKQLFRTKSLFDQAKYYIRIVHKDFKHSDLVWNVNEINVYENNI